MKREIGNMFDMYGAVLGPHMILVTTNSYKRRDGALVMGRGAAKQLAVLKPDVPYAFGRRLIDGQFMTYGVMSLPPQAEGEPWLGAFQVKYHFKDEANMELIQTSLIMLDEMARKMPHMRIDLNYPGIGNGRIHDQVRRKQLDKWLDQLPDNVHVWTFH